MLENLHLKKFVTQLEKLQKPRSKELINNHFKSLKFISTNITIWCEKQNQTVIYRIFFTEKYEFEL